MAITQVETTDTFDQWRVKTNTISTDLGDISALTTVASDAANALNEVDAALGDLSALQVPAASIVDAVNEARRLAFAITLALG